MYAPVNICILWAESRQLHELQTRISGGIVCLFGYMQSVTVVLRYMMLECPDVTTSVQLR